MDLVADLGVGLVVARLLDRPLGERVLDRLDHLLDDEGLELAGLAVEVGAHRLLDPVLLLGRRGHGVLERGDPALEVDVLLARHLAQDLVEVDFRRSVPAAWFVFLSLPALELDLQPSRLDRRASGDRQALAAARPASTTSLRRSAGRSSARRPTTVRLRPSPGSAKVTRASRPAKRA